MTNQGINRMTQDEKFEEMEDLLTNAPADAPDAPTTMEEHEQRSFFRRLGLGVLIVIAIYLYGSGGLPM